MGDSYLAMVNECEHGEVDRHPTAVVLKDRLGPGKDDVGYDWSNICPGGTTTRIEPDYEAASKAYKREWITWWDEGRAMRQPNWSDGEERVIRACVDAALRDRMRGEG